MHPHMSCCVMPAWYQTQVGGPVREFLERQDIAEDEREKYQRAFEWMWKRTDKHVREKGGMKRLVDECLDEFPGMKRDIIEQFSAHAVKSWERKCSMFGKGDSGW